MAFFLARGEDYPLDDDIEYFGFYQACKNTRGEFAIYKTDGSLAARGRVGAVPLFWNKETKEFSFEKDDESFDEFPRGHLYNAEKDRLVCWEPMYYDNPHGTSVNEAVSTLKDLLRDAIEFRIDKCDAFLLSPNIDGSYIVNSFLEPGTIETYTAIPSIVSATKVCEEEDQNRTIIFGNNLKTFLKENTEHRIFLTGIGCKELFSEDDKFDEFVPKITSDLEMYSPFLDSKVIEYVLDAIKPEMRPRVLYRLLYEEK